ERALLKGVKRQSLLDKGIISKRRITPDNLGDFQKVFFINAMIDLEDDISVTIPEGIISS
ncbi:MAG: hypothetical protein LBE27_01180, partial [Deltaproteobacteria bacterium]|nr:hypothetical protein [Deltaproteobacteria bacterium]